MKNCFKFLLKMVKTWAFFVKIHLIFKVKYKQDIKTLNIESYFGFFWEKALKNLEWLQIITNSFQAVLTAYFSIF